MRVRRLHKTAAHLEITAFINLIVVLVPFLLSTAVFSRLAVVDMALPGPGAALEKLTGDQLQLEVVVRRDALEVGDRVGGLIQRLPNTAKGHDLAGLSALALQLKARFPQQQDASVLAEPDTAYDQIVQVMDTLHSTVSARVAGREGQPTRAELFPHIVLGDAPVRAAAAAAAAQPVK